MLSERRTPFSISLLVAAAAVLAVLSIAIFRTGAPPDVDIRSGAPVVGKRTAVKVVASESRRGLSWVRVELIQGDRAQMLVERKYRPLPPLVFWGECTRQDEMISAAGRDHIPWLREGEATIRVTAGRAGTWLRNPAPVVRELRLPVRLTPPALHAVSSQTYAAQGGCELVVYRVGESSVTDGVRSGSWWFPGYPLPGGGRQDRFALFAIPYDMAEPAARLVAVDAAGNEAEARFIDRFFPRPFKSDSIDLTEPFIQKVVPEIMSHSGGLADRGSPLENFLQINRELRKQNAGELKQMAEVSASLSVEQALSDDAECQGDVGVCRPQDLPV